MRLPDRYCGGRGSDFDRHGWLKESPQAICCLWGFFESACGNQPSMVGWDKRKTGGLAHDRSGIRQFYTGQGVFAEMLMDEGRRVLDAGKLQETTWE